MVSSSCMMVCPTVYPSCCACCKSADAGWTGQPHITTGLRSLPRRRPKACIRLSETDHQLGCSVCPVATPKCASGCLKPTNSWVAQIGNAQFGRTVQLHDQNRPYFAQFKTVSQLFTQFPTA
jgi:hypothetical protein